MKTKGYAHIYPFQKKGITNFFVRAEIAKIVFKNESSFKRRGDNIQITPEECDELHNIEGRHLAKSINILKNDSMMSAKITEILEKTRGGA